MEVRGRKRQRCSGGMALVSDLLLKKGSDVPSAFKGKNLSHKSFGSWRMELRHVNGLSRTGFLGNLPVS